MAKPNIPVDIFHKCYTPMQACKYVRLYAKTYSIEIETVCRILWRYHRLSVDVAMINKCRQHCDTWSTDARNCAQHHTTVIPSTQGEKNNIFLASFMNKSRG